jgi:hypothetical protein
LPLTSTLEIDKIWLRLDSSLGRNIPVFLTSKSFTVSFKLLNWSLAHLGGTLNSFDEQSYKSDKSLEYWLEAARIYSEKPPEVTNMESTLSWRITKPLREFRSWQLRVNHRRHVFFGKIKKNFQNNRK